MSTSKTVLTNRIKRLRAALNDSRAMVPVKAQDLAAVLDYLEDLGDLPAARDRVLATCDHADSYDQGSGHWVSTNEIRAALEERK